MRARATMLAAVTAVVASGALAGCTEDRTDGEQRTTSTSTSASSPAPVPAPALGGPTPRPHRPPAQAMDSLERPIAEQLARRIAVDDLRLDYLDCPHWDHTVPSTMTCQGYVDGLVAPVQVRVQAAAGRGVSFDARLSSGMVATSRLETMLRHDGWDAADCGDVAAYPASVGTRIVCRVQRDAEVDYVVATVRSRVGRVTISHYATASSAP